MIHKNLVKFRPGMINQDANIRDCKQKRAKSNTQKDYEEDLINQLPDGIPIAVLSKLPINEAARTSILSRKWRYLWTNFSGALEFDGSPIMKDMKKDIKKASGRNLQMAMEIMYDAERKTYTNWINELLSSLKTSSLQGLKFWFQVGNGFDVDKWVHYAIQKKVQNLELYFGHKFEYVLPLHMFKVSGFNSLRVLHLKSITLTEEMLEYLLCCCLSLETLSLVNSGVPKTMKISGPSPLKLKCLELVRCWELTNLEIFAENLVSFKYYGSPLNAGFKCVPSLVEAAFGGSFVEFIRESFLPQIKVLKFDIAQNAPEVISWLSQLPKLKNLKKLELVASAYDGMTLSGCDLLLKASPSLWKFTLKILNTRPTFRTERKFTMECEYSLKELELVGFCGAASEVDFVMYIVENAIELQKVTIDTRLPTKSKLIPVGERFKTWDQKENRKRALELQQKISPWIEFVCL